MAPPTHCCCKKDSDAIISTTAAGTKAVSNGDTLLTPFDSGHEKAEGNLMKHQATLTISSLLSILLFSLHWAHEVARGIEPGTVSAAGGLLILAVWLCGTLVLSGRTGLVIIFLGAILAAGVPVLHMQGAGLVGGRIGNGASTAERFFWVWTNIALGASGLLSVVLSARALWSLRRPR
jgi:hypothetical protein